MILGRVALDLVMGGVVLSLISVGDRILAEESGVSWLP